MPGNHLRVLIGFGVEITLKPRRISNTTTTTRQLRRPRAPLSEPADEFSAEANPTAPGYPLSLLAQPAISLAVGWTDPRRGAIIRVGDLELRAGGPSNPPMFGRKFGS